MRPIADFLSLKDKEAVVTGAARGIGKAISRRLAEAGAKVHLLDLDERGLEKAVGEISSLGAEAKAHKVDLSSKKEIDSFWESFEGDPEILVNNVGVYWMKPFEEVDEGFLKKVFQINFFSAWWMSWHFVQRRGKKGGKIVNVGSIEAILPFKSDLAHYSATKAAIMSFTRSLAREYAKLGFRVNAVVPGGIMTEGVKEVAKKMGLKAISEGKEYLKRVPLGRLGNPDEVAMAVLFLVSDMSSYITGALLPVDGGFLST